MSMDLLDENINDLKEKKPYTGKSAGIAWKIEQAEEKIKRGRNVLYFIGGILALWGIVYLFTSIDFTLPIINLALAAVYFVCAYFSQKKPILAFSISLALYLSLHGLNYLLDPSTLMQGIIIKLFFTTALTLALFSGIQGHRLRKKLEDLN